MAVSAVTIANMALGNIGDTGNIESLTENSPQAGAVNLWYETAKEHTLESFDWKFARKREALALSSVAAPEREWLYRYLKPSDMVRARKLEQVTITPGFQSGYLYNSPDAIPFVMEGQDILTNCPEAVMIYTRNVVDESLFPASFVVAFSWVLASLIAFKITGKLQVEQSAGQKAQLFLRQASGYEANEEVEKEPRDSDRIRARY